MEFVKIWLFCIVAAILYGIVHDQVTAHVCVEYFSIAHPTILPLTSPTLLAFEWGVLATWWVGAALGFGLAVCARSGSRVPLSVWDVRRPVVALLLCMALASLASGIAGFVLAKTHVISLSGGLALAIPESKHSRFLADWWAHSAAYLVGILGGAIVCIRTCVKRGKAAAMSEVAGQHLLK
jgi:hypothetical protein